MMNVFNRECFNKFKIFFILSCLQNSIECSDTQRAALGYSLAQSLMTYYYEMFGHCVNTDSPNQKFLTDDLQSFVNYPSKTTVGFAPRFTSNRKFFANLLSTTAFKEMLANDEEELTKEFVRKLKHCDAIVMDQGLLQDFYDREVNPSRL